MPHEELNDEAIRLFVAEHPEWREQFCWEVLPGEHTTTALGTPKGLEAFIWWAYERGIVTRPANIPHELERLRRIDAECEAHEAGICESQTCHICQGRQGTLP
jgi:hypothetical protein